MEKTKFKIFGADKRQGFIGKQLVVSQKPRGKDVEYFTPGTGFILLNKLAEYKEKMGIYKNNVPWGASMLAEDLFGICRLSASGTIKRKKKWNNLMEKLKFG